MGAGRRALTEFAPEAAGALERVEAAAWADAARQGLGDLVELAGRACARSHGLPSLEPPSGTTGRWAAVDPDHWRTEGDLSDREVVGLEFAEQFSVDVAALPASLRDRLFGAFGAAAADYAAIVFVMDFLPRADTALDVLFAGAGGSGSARLGAPATPTALDVLFAGAGGSGSARLGAPATPTALGTGISQEQSGLWDALDDFTRTVPSLQALDPVLSELVRLRGARQHHCRLCASLRSRPALLAGADEALFAAADPRAEPALILMPSSAAALAFTDAMIWTPGHIPPQLAASVVAELSPDQRVELVLDVTRNALNKVAVALAADEPHVAEGIEIYDVDESGTLVYGLSLD